MRIRVVFAVVGSSLIQKFLRPRLKGEIIFHPLPGVPESCDRNSIRRKRRHARACRRPGAALPALSIGLASLAGLSRLTGLSTPLRIGSAIATATT
jgi:hypothetical protein